MVTIFFITVKFSGKYNNAIFDEREVTYEVGDCYEHQIIDGLDRAVKKFNKGEKSKLVISSKYAYGSHGSEEYDIPPQSEVEYTLELLDFTRVCNLTTISVVLKIFFYQYKKFNRVHKLDNNKVIKNYSKTNHMNMLLLCC